uniref:Uncharacterized protein n=1 Tax=Arundo donax TaxID=35708 RepID=A0A0A8Y8X9_ARUDO
MQRPGELHVLPPLAVLVLSLSTARK